MSVDAYTKAVLTVIAACLMWICVNGVTPVASAQAAPPPTPVILVDGKGAPMRALPVIVNNASVPVEITNPALNVAVQSIQRGTAWDPIRVQLLRESPTTMPVP